MTYDVQLTDEMLSPLDMCCDIVVFFSIHKFAYSSHFCTDISKLFIAGFHKGRGGGGGGWDPPPPPFRILSC